MGEGGLGRDCFCSCVGEMGLGMAFIALGVPKKSDRPGDSNIQNAWVLFSGHGVSVWEEEVSLEGVGGDGCTTV